MVEIVKNAPVIQVSKGIHREQVVIICTFAYDRVLLSKLKSIPSVKYSKTLRSWYLPYDQASWSNFKTLGVLYTITENNDAQTKHLNQGTILPSFAEQNKINQHDAIAPHMLTPHYIDQSGTVSTTSENDNAGIGTYQVAPSVHPSEVVSKGTDIHLSKGGRSIQFSGGNFYISIQYNDNDITFLKSLKGYW
ncbi:MAG: hypothetical protein WAU01_08650, partial [Saprospiraceae bacterium]